MRRERVGFFGGSFDPFHFGHLNLAISLLEAHALDSVLFCPAYVSPFKKACSTVASSEHRMQMVRLGIQEIKHFAMLDWEMKQKKPSYTIDTIQKLKKESTAEFFLLLGMDQLEYLHKWKKIEELLELAQPLIGSRENKQITLDHLPVSLHSFIDKGRTIIPMMDINSTIIRQRLSRKQFCGHLVPQLILDYIKHNHVYI